jgi:taurine-pyruvate aminotransferase
MGEHLMKRLKDRLAIIGDVRGKGLFQKLQLVADRTTKEPLAARLFAQVFAECDARGVLMEMTNRSLPKLNNTICLSPALTVTEDEIDQVAAGCLEQQETTSYFCFKPKILGHVSHFRSGCFSRPNSSPPITPHMQSMSPTMKFQKGNERPVYFTMTKTGRPAM